MVPGARACRFRRKATATRPQPVRSGRPMVVRVARYAEPMMADRAVCTSTGFLAPLTQRSAHSAVRCRAGQVPHIGFYFRRIPHRAAAALPLRVPRISGERVQRSASWWRGPLWKSDVGGRWLQMRLLLHPAPGHARKTLMISWADVCRSSALIQPSRLTMSSFGEAPQKSIGRRRAGPDPTRSTPDRFDLAL